MTSKMILIRHPILAWRLHRMAGRIGMGRHSTPDNRDAAAMAAIERARMAAENARIAQQRANARAAQAARDAAQRQAQQLQERRLAQQLREQIRRNQ